MFTKAELLELKDIISKTSVESKIYLGCDSARYKKDGIYFAKYTVVLVIHIEGKHGCKVYHYSESKKDYDNNLGKPIMRMLEEVMCITRLYTELEDDLIERDVAIHLDINPNKDHGSSCALQAAKGLIIGYTGIEPKFKPEAFAASCAADRL